MKHIKDFSNVIFIDENDVKYFNLDDKQMKPRANDKHENFIFKFPISSFQNCEKLGNLFSLSVPFFYEAAHTPFYSHLWPMRLPPQKHQSTECKLSLKTLKQP